MLLSSFLKSLSSLFSGHQASGAIHRRAAGRLRGVSANRWTSSALESLEKRTLLTPVTVDGTSGDDLIVVEEGPADQISVTVNGTQRLYDKPTGGDDLVFRVDGKLGVDTIEVNSVSLPDVEFQLQSELIVVSSSATVDAGDITFTARGADAGLSIADSLPVAAAALGDRAIVVNQGAQLSADNITLSAERVSSLLHGFRLFGGSDSGAGVNIDGAVIDATGDVSITTTSADENLTDDVPEKVSNAWTDAAISYQSGFFFDGLMPSIPLALMIRRSETSIAIDGNTVINAGGDVEVSSASVTDATTSSVTGNYGDKTDSGLAKFLDSLSVGYSQADATALVNLSGTTSITAGGAVDITSKATSTAAVTATTKRNTTAADVNSTEAADRAPSDTNALGASFAMSNTRTTATTNITEGVTITADGNVNVKAEGSVTNKAKAGLKIFVDGRGGLAVAIGLDETDVTAAVDGQITSGAAASTTVSVPLTDIDDSSDVINVEDHGLTDGEIITYRAVDPDNAVDANGNEIVQSPIGGLADGLEYRVIVIDDDHFQLSQAAALEIDARAIPAGQEHTLSLSEVVEFNPVDGAVDVDLDTIGITTDQLTEGSFVNYQMADSDPDANGDPEPIEGLVDGTTYIAINVVRNGDQAVFQLADIQDPDTPIDLLGTGVGDAHLIGFHRSGSNAISFTPNSDVDENENTITLPNHGLQTGDVLSYETDRDAPVQRRSITSHTFLLPPQTLDIDSALDPDALNADADTLTVFDAVEFSTGQRIVYSTTAAPIGGLTPGDAYFAIRLEDGSQAANGFQLAATQADALAGNAIDLTGSLSGVQTFTADPIDGDELTIRTHGFETGQEITYRAEGNPSAGLTDGATYFVIRHDANRLSLAASRSDALSRTILPLTDTWEVSEFQRFETQTVVELFDATRSEPVVDAINDTLYVPNHQLIDDTQVVYRASGATPGAVEEDTTYLIRVVDADHIQLLDLDSRDVIDLALPSDVGNGFHGLDVLFADIDIPTNTLFLSDHGLQLDDIVEYSSDGDTPIGGLVDGQSYGVNFLNGDEIQLLELDEDGVPTETVIALSAGATRDAVHQLVLVDEDSDESPTPLLFTPNLLSPPSEVTQLTFDVNALPGVDPVANTVRVLYHGLKTGDQVRYVSNVAAAGGSNVGGLTNGQQYEVVVIDQHTYRLQSGGAFVDLTSVATGDGRHGFERVSTVGVFQSPVRGLEDRAFYFVSVVDENTIQLAETAGDAAAIRPIDLTATLASGEAHQFRRQAPQGIGILSNLTAKNEVQAGSGLGGAPKFTDLLFSGDTQSPFSFTDPSSFTSPGAGSLQRGIARNDAKNTLRGAGGDANDTFSIAAGLAVAQADHDVRTLIGPNAILTSDFDVNVSSNIKQTLKVKSEGTVSSDDKTKDPENPTKPKKRDQDKKFAFGAGIAVGFFENSAITDLRSGATIDAVNDVDIEATVTYPLKANPIALLPFGGYYEPGASEPKDVDFFGEIKSLIGGKLGLDDIVNVWANTKAGGNGTKDGGAAKVALSGSIAVTDYENTAQVLVGSDVRINQDVSRRNLTQSVDIDASVLMELVSVAGQISIALNKEGIQNAHKKRQAGEPWANKLFSFYGNQAGEVGIGGSALSQTIDNTVEAIVASGARIYTGVDGLLTVNANEDVFTFEFVQSGGKSGKLGISGSVSVIQQDSHTVAHLQNGVTVTGGDVVVDADNVTRHIALLGAIQASKSLGVGVTVGVQLIERNTLAIVGSERVTIAADAVDSDKNRIRIAAHGFQTGDRVIYHAADAPIDGLVDGQTYFVVKDNERQIQLASSQANALAEDPVVRSLDASAAGDEHHFEIPADAGVIEFQPGDVNSVSHHISVASHNLETGDAVQYWHDGMTAVGGIGPAPGLLFVIRLSNDRIQFAQTREDALNGNAIALSPAASGTQRIERVLMFDVTDVVVEATNDGYIASVGIAGAIVSNTESTPESEQENDGGSPVPGPLDAAASVGQNDDSDQDDEDGGSSGGVGDVAAGAAEGIGADTDDNSTARKSGIGIAGDASWNQLEQRTLAVINSDGQIHATDVAATAAETTDVYAVSGAVAIANADDTAVAIAGSFNRNKVDMTTEVIVSGLTLDVGGSLAADAVRTGDLIGISLGVAGSKVSNNANNGRKKRGFAFGGSVAVNTIDNVTRATIDHVAGEIDGAVTATTGNDSTIFAIGGGAGIAINGQVGFGAGVGVNTVRTTTESVIDSVDLNLNSTVDVTATNDILLESLGVSAGVGQFGIAGTFAVNEIDPVTSAVIRDSDLQHNDGDVTLTALDKSRIRADAGGVAVGVKLADQDDNENAVAGAFGVAVSLNQIGTRDGSGTIAAIENSTLNNPGDVTLDAESQAQITGLTVAGSVAVAKQSGSQKGSLSLAGAGAGSRNLLTTDIIASISDSTLIRPDNVSVTATDHARIHADAGGFAISVALNSGSGSSNAVGVGVGVAVNDLFGSTTAEIVDSSIGTLANRADRIEVRAIAEDPDDNRAIEALAMGGSVAVGVGTGSGQSGAFAGAGAITRNRIFRNVTADIADTSAFATDSIDVQALDQSTINGDAGGVSIAVGASTGGKGGSGSIGVSVAINEIGSREDNLGVVAARVTDSFVIGGGDVTVDARSVATIDAVSIAGSLSVSASSSASSFSGSGAGSFSDNVIEKSITSAIVGTQMGAAGDVVVSAGDDSFIRSVVVGAAISVSASASGTSGTVTIGASIAQNTIDNTTLAVVDNSLVTANGDVTVRSTADATTLGQLPTDIPAELIAPTTPAGQLLNNPILDDIFPDVFTMAALLDELATTEKDNKETDNSSTASAAGSSNERLLDELFVDPLFESLLRTVWNDPAYVGGDLSDSIKVTFMSSDEIDEASQATVGNRATGNGWTIVDRRQLRTYQVLELDDGTLQVRAVNIQAVSAAASVSVSAGTNSVGIAGAGASTRNVVLSTNDALVTGSLLNASGTAASREGNVTVEARKVHGIVSTVVAAAAGVGVSSGGSGGAGAIGASLARNFIGYEAGGDRSPATARAILDDSQVTADGELNVNATTAQKITTVVVAASVGVSASPGGGVAVGLAGAGASAINRIAADAQAEIRSISGAALNTNTIHVSAVDSSIIRATAGAVAVSVAFAPDVTVAISLGVGLARNTITSESTASIIDSSITTIDTGVTVTADSVAKIEAVAFAAAVGAGISPTGIGVGLAGAGAEATNIIQTATDATVSGSTLTDVKDVTVAADSQAEIEATVVSIAVGVGYGTVAGAGAAIGVSLARNFIGFAPDTLFTPTYTTADDKDVRAVDFGQTVQIESGVRAGDVYRYIGRDENGAPNRIEAPDDFGDGIPEEVELNWLTTIDYGRSDQWELVNLNLAPSSVKAAIENSRLNISEDVTVTALATQKIRAIVVAGSAALGAGGGAAVGLSGSGVATVNRIANTVVADLSDTSGSSSARHIKVQAADASDITVFAGSVAIAGAFGGGAVVSGSLGVSVARNEIRNDVNAAIRNANFNAESILVTAAESSSIEATSFAASLAVAVNFLGGPGLSFSGAGADAINIVNNQIGAVVEDSYLLSAGSIDVLANNASALDAEVVAVSAAVSGGAAAVAGSIGAAIARNLVGVSSPRDVTDGAPDSSRIESHSATAQIINSTTLSLGGDTSVRASSNQIIDTVAAAGSVAVAVGAGFGGAGSGTEATSIIAGSTVAEVRDSTTVAAGDIDVVAVDDSFVRKSQGIGAAIAGGFVSGAIGITVVRNDIINEVAARVADSVLTILGPESIDAEYTLARDGSVNVLADSNARIGSATAPVVAATASVAAGVSGFSGAGVLLDNQISSAVTAMMADSRVRGAESVSVNAQEQAAIYTDAAAIAASFSLGVAGGVSILDSTIGSEIVDRIANSDIRARRFVGTVATVDAEIPRTYAVAVGASGVAGFAVNEATSTVAHTVVSEINDSEIQSESVAALVFNDVVANAQADGGAFGGVATTGMAATVNIGRGDDVNEITAAINGGTINTSRNITVLAQSSESVLATTTAGSAGLVSVDMSRTAVNSDIQPVARIGDDTVINALGLQVTSRHDQAVDALADSYSLGLGSGAGAQIDVALTGGSLTEIGENVNVTAERINIQATNSVQRKSDERTNAGVPDLHVGPFGLASVSDVSATTNIGTATTPLDAAVTIGTGASLNAVPQSDGNLTELNIQAYNDIRGRQSTELEGAAALAFTTAQSILRSNSNATVNTDDAELLNRTGDVVINATTDADLKSDADLLIFSVGGEGRAVPTADIVADNQITINGGRILGESVDVLAGRRFDSIGAVRRSRLDAATFTSATTFSIYNADDSVPSTNVNWSNDIDITGDAAVQALRDVDLIAERLRNSAVPTAVSAGEVINASGGAVGSDDALDQSQTAVAGSSEVTIGLDADVRGGLENESSVLLRPSSVNGVPQYGSDRIGETLTSADKQHFGLSENVEFEFAPINLDSVEVAVSRRVVVRVAAGHTAGGDIGALYRFAAVDTGTSGLLFDDFSENVRLDAEDYRDISRWERIADADVADFDSFPQYSTDLAVQLAADLQDRFFAVKNTGTADVTVTLENIGVQLLQQRRELQDWIFSHTGSTEALARHQAQLAILDQTIEDLGLFIDNTYTDGTTQQTERILNPELDAIFIHVPDVEATPGSVFIEANSSNTQAAAAAGAVRGSDGSTISLNNLTPFNLVTNNAKINNNRRVTYVDDQLVTLEAGRVYQNFVPVNTASVAADNTIRIFTQPTQLTSADLGGRSLPDVPHDLYINGDVVNEDGRLIVRNLNGGISVEGTLVAQTIDVQAAGDFNLNTDDWFHSAKDPRQLIDFSSRRQQARDNGFYAEGDAEQDLLDAINDGTDAALLANGNINITARYLNINGLIQSGATEIQFDVERDFAPGGDLDSLIDTNGEPLPGVVYGASTPLAAVNARFEESGGEDGNGAIIIAPIRPAGGNIVLAGQIFSTGNGRVIAAAGRADIDIANHTDFDLVIEGIDNSPEREGVITIIDTSTLDRTVYRSSGSGITEEYSIGQVVETPVGDNRTYRTIDYVSTGVRNEVPAADGTVLFYPGADQRTNAPAATDIYYSWVDGQDSSTVTTTVKTRNGFNLFGANNSIADLLRDDDLVTTVDGPITLDDQPLLQSQDLQRINGQADLAISYEKIVSQATTEVFGPEFSGGGWLRPISVTQTEVVSQVNKDVFTTFLRADYPVAVGFSNGNPNPVVEVFSTRNLVLDGNIDASKTGRTELKTQIDGNLIQNNNAAIFGTELLIDVGNDAEAFVEGGTRLTVRNVNDLSLQAVSLDNQSSTIDIVSIDADGDVSLIAPQGVRRHPDAAFGDLHITSRDLHISATDGAVGPLNIDTTGPGELTVDAAGSITLKEVSGDIRLGQLPNRPASIVSEAGSVFLTADSGSIRDRLIDGPQALSEEEVAALDQRLRLTGEQARSAALEQVEAEQRRETAVYHEYWQTIRGAVPGDVLASATVSQINGNLIQLNDELDLNDGDVIFYEVGFDLTSADTFTSGLWESLSELNEDERITYDAAVLTAGTQTVMNPGEIVVTGSGSLFRYVGGSIPSWDLQSGPYYKVGGNELLTLGDLRYESATGLDQRLFDPAGTTGSFDQVRFVVRSFDSTLHSDIDVNQFTPEQTRRFLALHNSLTDADAYNANFVFRLSTAEVDARIAARSFTEDQLRFPLSGALLDELFPGSSSFAGSSLGAQADSEHPNIIASSITLFASENGNSAGGQIGGTTGTRFIDFREGFAELSDADKATLSEAAPEDVSFKHYTSYQYSGPAGDLDAAGIDFTDGQWTRIDPDIVLSQTPAPPSLSTGAIVLNDVSSDGGLFRYTGESLSGNLTNLTFFNLDASPNFERLTPVGSNLEGQLSVEPGELVSDISDLQFLTLRPVEDVNIASSSGPVSLTVNAVNGVAIHSADDVVVRSVRGGDVRLSATGDVTSFPFGNQDFGNIVSDGEVFVRANSLTAADGSAFPLQMFGEGRLGGAVSGDFFVRQTDGPFLSNPVTGLEVSRIDAGGDVSLTSEGGAIELGSVATTGDVVLDAAGGIFNVSPKLAGDIIANIQASNARLVAGDDVGNSGTGDVGVALAGHLQVLASGRVNVSSTSDLNVADINSDGSIRLRSLADINLIDQASVNAGGSITFNVDDDFTSSQGSQVTSPASVLVIADALDNDAEGGTVTVEGGINASSLTIFTAADNDIIDVSMLNIPVSIGAGDGDDRIFGSQAADEIIAGPGNDFVLAGAGNDRLRGGVGDDDLFGGPGDDHYIFENVGTAGESDLVSEQPNEGTDTVDFSTTTAGTAANPSTGDLIRTAERSVRITEAGAAENFEVGLNINPLIEMTTAPTELIAGQPGEFEATWYDVGTQTTHSSLIVWLDGFIEAGTLLDNGTTGTIAASHVYDSAGTFEPQFSVTDEHGRSASTSTIVRVISPVPTADAGGPYVINEGSSLTLDGSGSVDETDTGLTYLWDVDGDGDFDENVTGVNPALTWQQLVDLGITDGPYAGTIGLSVANDFDSDASATTLTVNNVAPQVDSVQLTPEIIEGDVATLRLSFSDPGTADTHTVDIDWGDGSDLQTVAVPAGDRTLELTHTYTNNLPEDNRYAVLITVTDDEGASGSASGTVRVRNAAPVVDDIRIDSQIDENGTATVEIDFSDAGVEDTHTVEINWGDGSDVEVVAVPAGEYSLTRSHQYLDDEAGTADDLFPITVRIIDSDGGDVSATDDLLVNNVAPTLSNVTSSTDSVDCISHDGTVTVSGEFSDIGTLDTHTVTIDWGDGSAPVIFAATENAFAETHLYAGGGTYAITITVQDDDGGSVSQTVSALLTGTQLTDGTLRIFGTDQRDIVQVWQRHGHVYVKTKLGTNGWTWDAFPAADVTHIEVVTCDGDDYVWLKPAAHVTTTVETGNGRDRISTGNGRDVIDSGAGSDEIYSDGGDDLIRAGAGNDIVFSGTGDDEIDAGDGHDRVYSWTGDDVIFAGAGSDFVDGGYGNDRIEGGTGNDYLKGQSGDDVILGDAGHDHIDTGDGDNLVLAGTGNDVIYGGRGNDILVGGDGHDCIHGDRGNDIIIGGLGSDWIDGDRGRDLLIAGATHFDENEAALDAIYTEWNSSDSWSTKIANLRTGSGSHLNGVRLEAGVTVFDDNALDQIWGGRGNDWYFASSTDRLRDRRWWELWSRTN